MLVVCVFRMDDEERVRETIFRDYESDQEVMLVPEKENKHAFRDKKSTHAANSALFTLVVFHACSITLP